MKIALLTYHSAYNFGSALQAYATQEKLKDLGFDVDIINYRMDEQKYFYEKSYRTKYGPKCFLRDLTMLTIQGERHARQKAFEDFFAKYMNLTEEVSEPEDVEKLLAHYGIAISGSDQILNKHSVELEYNDWRYMNPYLLKGYHGRKISYASSVGNMNDDELGGGIIPELKMFDSLSFREQVTCRKIGKMLDRPVENVLDPTFLLTSDEWVKRLGLKKTGEKKYILAYSLGGVRMAVKLIPLLRKMSEKRKCQVKLVMPFFWSPFAGKHIEWCLEYGPIEFLDALYNAEQVVTDSYHGTVLSVNFGKDFFSLCEPEGSNFRKTDILERLGLSSRVVYEPREVLELDCKPIDYHAVSERLSLLRQHSKDYLEGALRGGVMTDERT